MEIWSFFSGAMGLDIGLANVGLKPTLAVELDKWCCETIRNNEPKVELIQCDVRNITGADLRARRRFSGDVYLMAGGPPCQSFSPGGKRAALNDPRGNLIYEYLRLIAEIKPRNFIFENVANLVTAALQHRKIKDRPGQHWSLKRYEKNDVNSDDGAAPLTPEEMSGSAIRQILSDVQGLGYNVVFSVVNAADYGAPQKRLRFVMIGTLDEQLPCIPPPTHGAAFPIKPYRTVRQTIEDLKENPGPHSVYTPEMARYFEHVPEGGNWRDLPEYMQEEAMGGAYKSGGGKTGFFRRLSWDEPAPTITGRANRKASAICHPEKTRPLSVRECARLQGFPDHWRFSGATNQQYLQVGNAVPIQLAEAIGSSILKPCDVQSAQSIENSYEVMLEKSVKKLRASARNKRSRGNNLQQRLL